MFVDFEKYLIMIILLPVEKISVNYKPSLTTIHKNFRGVNCGKYVS